MPTIIPAFKKSFEEKKILFKIDKIFSEIRGYAFKMPKKKSSVILVVSGGLDSVSLWLLLLRKYCFTVYPIYFDNGNSSQKKSILFFSKYFHNKYPSLSKPLSITKKPYPTNQKITQLNDMFVLANLVYNKIDRKYAVLFPSSPTRSFYFNFYAFEYAYLLKQRRGININTVFTGIVPDDAYFVRESTLTTLRAINLAFCLIFGDSKWQFSGPLEKKSGFYYTKSSLINYALKNNLPIEKAWSCDNRHKYHCGECPSCKTRIEVFQKLKIKDKTVYRKPFLDIIVKIFKKYIKKAIDNISNK